MLPHRLRRRVGALHEATSQGPENTGSNVADPEVDAEVLATLAAAVRDHERVRLDHPPDGDRPLVVEPYRLVSWQRRWYLVAQGRRGRWRALRVDRLRAAHADAPAVHPGAAAGRGLHVVRVARGRRRGLGACTRASRCWRPLRRCWPGSTPTVGVVESVDDTTSVLVTGADSLEMLAVYIGMLGLEFRVDGPPALVEHLRVVGERYARALPP